MTLNGAREGVALPAERIISVLEEPLTLTVLVPDPAVIASPVLIDPDKTAAEAVKTPAGVTLNGALAKVAFPR